MRPLPSSLPRAQANGLSMTKKGGNQFCVLRVELLRFRAYRLRPGVAIFVSRVTMAGWAMRSGPFWLPRTL